MRTKIVAGNWKMNKNVQESIKLADEIVSELKDLTLEHTRVLVAPPFVNISEVVKITEATPVEVAAQNMHQASSGAYTGEIAAEMLTSLGLQTVILGHSERREYFGENDAILTQKVSTALDHKLEVIFCFGEVLADRKSGKHFEVVAAQLRNVLFELSPDQWSSVVLAYEPVWAIGTGETASPEQAQEMHAFIRRMIADHYTQELADGVSILYGGSVKPSNAQELFANPDVDGGLIGGASLQATDFVALVRSF